MQICPRWINTTLITAGIALAPLASSVTQAQNHISATPHTPTWLKLASGLTLGAWAFARTHGQEMATPAPVALDKARMPYDRLLGTSAAAGDCHDPHTFGMHLGDVVFDTSDIQLVVNRDTHTIDLSGTWTNAQGDTLRAASVQLSEPSTTIQDFHTAPCFPNPYSNPCDAETFSTRLTMLQMSGTLKLNDQVCNDLQIVQDGFQIGKRHNLRNANYGAFAHFSCKLAGSTAVSEGKIYLDLSEDKDPKFYLQGYQDGYSSGTQEGSEEGYERGYELGYEHGYKNGREDGYQNGYEEGQADRDDDLVDL
ncbi:MAG: hypothetical protein OXT67_01455 [Zetaproteobacteria bacterium]|nr:hypothetical protein [Zetaproteobacteria bacterium]